MSFFDDLVGEISGLFGQSKKKDSQPSPQVAQSFFNSAPFINKAAGVQAPAPQPVPEQPQHKSFFDSINKGTGFNNTPVKLPLPVSKQVQLENLDTPLNAAAEGIKAAGAAVAERFTSSPFIKQLANPDHKVENSIEIAGSFAGGGPEEAQISKLVGASTEKEVASVLKGITNLTKAAIANIAPKIAKETNPSTITSILKDAVGSKGFSERDFNKLIPAIKGVKTAEITTPEIPKAEFVPPVASQENAAAKLALSKGTLLKRQGEHGQQLYDLVNNSINRQQEIARDATGSLSTVLKINKNKELRNNFIDVLHGNAQPINIDVQNAVKEWQDFTPAFRQLGVDKGLNIGDLGPEYFPHNIDYQAIIKDKSKYNLAINHLLKSGQASTPEEAVRVLQDAAKSQGKVRRFGNFESSRTVDLPGFDRGKNVIPSYIEGGSRRIAQAEQFGPNYNKVDEIIANIAKSGKDAGVAAKVFDQFVNTPATSKTLREIRGGLSASRLGLTAVTHAGQTANTAVESGVVNTLKGYAGLLSKEERNFVKDTNVLAETKQLRTQQGFEGAAGKVTAPGLSTMMKFNRSVSAIAGKSWAENLAAKGDEASLNILRDKLGVTGDIGKVLTDQQKIEAARTLVQHTQFRSTPLDTPLNAETNLGKTIGQFRSGFGYKQTGFVYNQIIKEARNGNIAPLIRAGILYPIAGVGVITAKDTIKNGVSQAIAALTGQSAPEAKSSLSSNPAIAALQGANQAGAFGLPGEIANNFQPQYLTGANGQVDSTKLIQAVAGTVAPAAGTAVDLTARTASALNGKPEELGRFGIGLTPVVGSQLAKAALPYKAKASSKGRIKRGKVSKGRKTKIGKGKGRKVATRTRAIKALTRRA